MIDMDKFVARAIGSPSTNKHPMRLYLRGFMDIEYDLITHGQQHRPFESVCELGIGGGGKQNLWSRCGASLVLGIDIIDPDDREKWGDWYDRDWDISQSNLLPGIHYVWNTNGYDPDTPKKIGLKFDIVLDDSDTNVIWNKSFNNKHAVINTWQDWITDGGLFITETPNGQDQDSPEPRPLEAHMPAFEYLASTGMVIFDTTKLAQPLTTDVMANGRTAYHLGVWTRNWDDYRPVMERYKDYIVAGYKNVFDD